MHCALYGVVAEDAMHKSLLPRPKIQQLLENEQIAMHKDPPNNVWRSALNLAVNWRTSPPLCIELGRGDDAILKFRAGSVPIAVKPSDVDFVQKQFDYNLKFAKISLPKKSI